METQAKKFYHAGVVFDIVSEREKKNEQRVSLLYGMTASSDHF